jgi:hypothetical protein
VPALIGALQPSADHRVSVHQLLALACAAVGRAYEPVNADGNAEADDSSEQPLLWTTAALLRDAQHALLAVGAFVRQSSLLQRSLERQATVSLTELVAELEGAGVHLSELQGGGAAQRLLAANSSKGRIARASLERLLGPLEAAGCAQPAIDEEARDADHVNGEAEEPAAVDLQTGVGSNGEPPADADVSEFRMDEHVNSVGAADAHSADWWKSEALGSHANAPTGVRFA